jgi:hypothetical protein
MKKINTNYIGFAVVIVMVGISLPALAKQIDNVLIVSESVDVRQNFEKEATTSSRANIKNDDNLGSSSEKNKSPTSTKIDNDNKGNNTTDTINNAELHRSSTASFVENLLIIADRNPRIGEEVRIIAKEQNDSATTTEKAMNNIENRGFLKTLILGDDYKNLGVIRSEVTKTENQIEKMKLLISKTIDMDDKLELENQLKILEGNQIKVNEFIKTHENSFSFLGWFVKLFNNK